MGPVIRHAVRTDRDAIEDALTQSAAFNQEEIVVALELFAEGSAAGYSVFVAEIDGRVSGYTCVGRAPLTDATWYLYWICVHPQVQGQGVGAALLRHTEDFVRSQSGRRIVVETSGRPDYDRARRFYTLRGYEMAGIIDEFYRPGDDCVIYVKRLGDSAEFSGG